MAFPILSKPLSSALFIVTILHLLIIFPLPATSGGFTVDLIPRDSPLSPFYNPSKTHYDSLHDAFQRSLKRINHFKSVLSAPESKMQTKIKPAGGEFLMNISIGTPPTEFLGIADTGSDLTWTQCLPCELCFHQNLPLFDPRRSSTYETIPCQSTSCDALGKEATCSGGQQNTCEYRYSYGDNSHTSGDLSSETFTIGNRNPVSLTKIVFGCAHDSGGTFDEYESGIIGLGGGKLSLISQMDESLGKKFSYCLVLTTSNVPGKISFGSDAVVSAPGAITTRLVAKSPDTYYYLTLEGISVGDERIAYKGAKSTTVPGAADDNVDEGNIIIDSGTTLTFLPSEFYNDLESAVERAVRGERVKDPRGDLSLCYRSNGDNLQLPVLTAHFKGGDVKLQPLNTFIRINDDTVCFTMIRNPDMPTFGNLAQMNFNVGYDLEAGTVSFLPTDCTKQ